MKRALILCAVAVLASLAGPAVGAMGFSNVADPRVNVAPTPDYTYPCFAAGGSSATCRASSLAAVNHARALEHLRPMVLPSGFWSLSGTKQVFIVTNLERVARGLKPFVGLTSQLDGWALTAARHNTDPTMGTWSLAGGVSAFTEGAIWAADYNVLDADYGWMYQDGWGGSAALTRNIVCTRSGAFGCWGHREIVLGRFSGASLLLAGVGAVAQGYSPIFGSLSEIFVGATGKLPPLAYTWKQAVAAGAR